MQISNNLNKNVNLLTIMYKFYLQIKKKFRLIIIF